MLTFKQNVNNLVKTLEDRILDMEIKFLSPHSDPLEAPDKYALDVQCYAVLCHAAFEEYAEGLCLSVLEYIDDNFKSKCQFSKATLCLLHFSFGVGIQSPSVSDWNNKDSLFKHIEIEIKKRKGKLSDYALNNNHGVDVKYLHSLFLPIGIDMPHDANEGNSLNQLARLRGFYAHAHSSTRPNAVNVTSPQTVVNYVMDVLKYMRKSAEDAINMSNYDW